MFDCDFDKSFTVETSRLDVSTNKDRWVEIDSNKGRLTPNTDNTQLFRESNWGKEFFLDTYASVRANVGDRVIIGGKIYDINHITEHEDPDDKATYIRMILFKTETVR